MDGWMDDGREKRDRKEGKTYREEIGEKEWGHQREKKSTRAKKRVMKSPSS
jgi:hypothetical protein